MTKLYLNGTLVVKINNDETMVSNSEGEVSSFHDYLVETLKSNIDYDGITEYNVLHIENDAHDYTTPTKLTDQQRVALVNLLGNEELSDEELVDALIGGKTNG